MAEANYDKGSRFILKQNFCGPAPTVWMVNAVTWGNIGDVQ